MSAVAEAGSRGRRSPRPSGDDRERAIVTTLERLLAERSFGSISVDELARGAGISRPTFYFYFSSKQAVLLALLDRMVAEVDVRLDGLARPGEDRAAWWRSVLAVFVDVFTTHRAATLALAEARAQHAEVRAVWADRCSAWVASTAAVIAAEQRRGLVRSDVDADAISIALNALNERAIGASLAGERPALPAAGLLDTLVTVWVGAIYGSGRTDR